MELLQRDVLLHDPRGRQQDGRAQIGDVARLASGRLVARVRFDFGDGIVGYAYRDYQPGESPAAAPQCAAPENWARYIDEEMNRWPGRYRQLGPRVEQQELLELKRFRTEWPHLAARIEATIGLDVSPAPFTLFELGPVWWANPRVSCADSAIDWRSLADQHAAGDFGLYGEWSDAPLTDEELWTLEPVAVANRAALAAGSGAVRSRFVMSDACIAPTWLAAAKRGAVDVVTVLSPKRGPRTLMTTVVL